jgi:hypothetical protein
MYVPLDDDEMLDVIPPSSLIPNNKICSASLISRSK